MHPSATRRLVQHRMYASVAMADGGAPSPNMHVEKADNALASPPQSLDVQIRKEFPECWIYFSNGSDDGLVHLTNALYVTLCTV